VREKELREESWEKKQEFDRNHTKKGILVTSQTTGTEAENIRKRKKAADGTNVDIYGLGRNVEGAQWGGKRVAKG